MHSLRNRGSRLEIGKTGRISIYINNPERDFDRSLNLENREKEQTRTIQPALIDLFGDAQWPLLPWPERFPRLTFVAIAVALLLTAITAEFDYLRGAGYFWPQNA